MIEAHLRRLRHADAISAEEEAVIRAAFDPPQDVPADRTIIRAGQELTASTLLIDGMMCRYKDLRDGQRQITELHIAGDFVDLHSFTLKRLDHNILTLTPCRIATMPHEALAAITETYPHLTRVYWFLTMLDAALHREWAVSLGRRTALQRLAHLFCELHVRLDLVGLADGTSFACALTQPDLAECVGLTAVHVNRTLRELREAGLVEVSNRRVRIHDLAALRRAAEFDDAYLYVDRRVL